MTQEQLKELLHYNSDTGVITYRSTGRLAGTQNKETKAIVISIRKKSYLAHRLAVLYMTGKNPENDVRHLDNNKANNQWANLVQCTRSENVTKRYKND